MSKKGLPDDLLNQTLGGRPAPTAGSAPPAVADDPLELVQVRLPRSMKADLLRHFQSRGLTMSAGVRMVLADYRNQTSR